MKIAFILSKCHKYGSSRYIVEISKYFSKWGYKVHVFANTCDSVPWIIFHKIHSVFSNYLLREGITNFLETIILKKYDFDITIAQPARYFSPDICHVRFLSKAAHEKLGYKEDFASKITSLIEGYNLKKCKRIIAMSNRVKQEIIKYHKIPEEKIEVVYDGVNLEEFSPKNKILYRKKIREKYHISKNDIVLLFAGNPFSRKGLEYVIRALPLIKEKNVKFLVLGNDNIKPYLELAKKLKIQSSIIYAGFTKEINKYFAAADIFVFPTLYEPFGLVILEAMASGLPVITSAKAGAAELIGKKEGLLLENPKNPKEIAEKVNYLIDNNLINRFGKNARKKAKHYTWQRTAKEMEKVFKNVKII